MIRRPPDLDAPIAAAMNDPQVRAALAPLRPSERAAAHKAIADAIGKQAAAQLKARAARGGA